VYSVIGLGFLLFELVQLAHQARLAPGSFVRVENTLLGCFVERGLSDSHCLARLFQATFLDQASGLLVGGAGSPTVDLIDFLFPFGATNAFRS
jgi:hypothetical protein